MKLSPAALETMGESANDGLVHPFVWGPALIGAAQQIRELEAALAAAEADRKALMEVVRAAAAMSRAVALNAVDEWVVDEAAYMGMSDALSELPYHLRTEAEGSAG